MKKVFKIEDLDCAHCAARLETAIQKVDGVSAATVSFLAQKLTVEAADERFDEVMKAVVKAAKRSVPECRILL